MKKRSKKGFTLIELIVVIAILGILALIAIPTFLGMREKANEGTVKSNLRNVQAAAVMYATTNNIKVYNVSDSGTVLTTILGNWPVGPGTTSYKVVLGKSYATLSDIPYPTDGVNTYDGISFTKSATIP